MNNEYHSRPLLVNRPGYSRTKRTGAPNFSDDQRTRLVRLLKQAGAAGISRERFLDPHDLAMSQVGARRDELEKRGFKIGSFHVRGERFVRYRLDFEPSAPITGWRSQGFQFGKPENYAGSERKPAQPAKQEQLFDTRAFVSYETGGRR